jgi:hypothetical protein
MQAGSGTHRSAPPRPGERGRQRHPAVSDLSRSRRYLGWVGDLRGRPRPRSSDRRPGSGSTAPPPVGLAGWPQTGVVGHRNRTRHPARPGAGLGSGAAGHSAAAHRTRPPAPPAHRSSLAARTRPAVRSVGPGGAGGRRAGRPGAAGTYDRWPCRRDHLLVSPLQQHGLAGQGGALGQDRGSRGRMDRRRRQLRLPSYLQPPACSPRQRPSIMCRA